MTRRKWRGRVLILIGIGLAGFHIKARAAMDCGRNWLVFDECDEAHDFYQREEIESWCEQGVLELIAFSHDQAQRRYVQHALVDTAKSWAVGRYGGGERLFSADHELRDHGTVDSGGRYRR